MDVVTLLEQQHIQIREMFADLETAKGDDRRDLFEDLVRFLAVHETAEEEVVHPAVRLAGTPGTDAEDSDLRDLAGTVVDTRLAEERKAKELLTSLTELGPDAEGFDTLLLQLRDDVLAHAEHEEREEFPLLYKAYDGEQLERMASAIRVAEALAPTRPHPGVESAKANLLVGPPAAIMDRARDLIRDALRR
jgi:hemerythrin superfamily protein